MMGRRRRLTPHRSTLVLLLLLALAAPALAAPSPAPSTSHGPCPRGCNANGAWDEASQTCACFFPAAFSPSVCCLHLVPEASRVDSCELEGGKYAPVHGPNGTCQCNPSSQLYPAVAPVSDFGVWQACTSTHAYNAGVVAGAPSPVPEGLRPREDVLVDVQLCASCDAQLVGLALVRPSNASLWLGRGGVALVQFSPYAVAVPPALVAGRPPLARLELPRDAGWADRPAFRAALVVSDAARRAFVAVAGGGTQRLYAAPLTGPGHGAGLGAWAAAVSVGLPVRSPGSGDWTPIGGGADADGAHAYFVFTNATGAVAVARLSVADTVLRGTRTFAVPPAAVFDWDQFQDGSCAVSAGGFLYCLVGSGAALVGVEMSASMRVVCDTPVRLESSANSNFVGVPSRLVVSDVLPRLPGSPAPATQLVLFAGIESSGLFARAVVAAQVSSATGEVVRRASVIRPFDSFAQSISSVPAPVMWADASTGLAYVVDGGEIWAVRMADLSTAGTFAAPLGPPSSTQARAVVDLGSAGRQGAVAPVSTFANAGEEALTSNFLLGSVLVFAGDYVSPNVNSLGSAGRGNSSSRVTAVAPAGCALGTAADERNSANAACSVVPAGMYGARTAIALSNTFSGINTTLVACPPGTVSPLASWSVAMCAPCPVGTYQPSAGAASCLPCPAGSFCPLAAVAPLDASLSPGAGPAVVSASPGGGGAGSGAGGGVGGSRGGGGISGELGGVHSTATVVVAATLLVLLAAWTAAEMRSKVPPRVAAAVATADRCFSRRHRAEVGDPMVRRQTSLGGAFSVATAGVGLAVAVSLLLDYATSNEVRSVSLVATPPGEGQPALSIEVRLTMFGAEGLCRAGASGGRWTTDCGSLGLLSIVRGVGDGGAADAPMCRARGGGACDFSWRCESCPALTGQAVIGFESLEPSAWIAAASWNASTPSVLAGGDRMRSLAGRLVPSSASLTLADGSVNASSSLRYVLRSGYIPLAKVSPDTLVDHTSGTTRSGYSVTYNGEQQLGTAGHGGSPFWPENIVEASGRPVSSGGAGQGPGTWLALQADNVGVVTELRARQTLLSLFSSISGGVVGVVGLFGVLLAAAEAAIATRLAAKGGHQHTVPLLQSAAASAGD